MNANQCNLVTKDYVIFLSTDYTDFHKDCFVFNLASSADDGSGRIIFSILNPNLNGSAFYR